MLQSPGYWVLLAVHCLLIQPWEVFLYPGPSVQWGILMQERNET